MPLGAPVALLLMSSGLSTAAAQDSAILTRQLDSIAAADVRQHRAVGTVAAVVKGTDTLLFAAYGKANVEWDVPMHTDAMFEVGSVTKQFTAVAILQLRDQGKLGLDDDLTQWLPDFDTRGNRVTLRHLLDHTSGIADVTKMPEWGQLVTSMRFPPDSMYALIGRQPFQFPTGTAQAYNNSAFWLLGLVIEKASGIRYDRYIEERIFEPLGMHRSMFCFFSENVPRRASGYLLRNGVIRRAPLNVPIWYVGSGSLCSTAGDLITWLQALHGGKVLSPGSYAELLAPAKLADGTPLPYAMGLQVNTDARGLAFIGHSGEIPGYAARANWYPEANMAVVVLMNNSIDASATAMAEQLAGAVLRNP